MADAEYRPNQRGWDAVALSPQILAACVAEAERGMAYAITIAPRSDDGDGKPYADSFEVQAVVVRFRQGPRVAARLLNDAPHAAAVEFGNRQTPRAQRVLGRTAAYLGGGG